jgi:outer membrane protein OmpA-like peptidoglycan-associated protein
MNTETCSVTNLRKTLIVATVASVLLAACAAAPLKPDGAAEVRNKLTQLQSDPNLGSRAPLAIKEADAAVSTAEQPQADKDLAAYRVYLADRKVETARAQAETRFAEDQRAALSAQRERARLNARTQEADAAKSQAATSRMAAANSEQEADAAKSQAATSRLAAASSEQEADAARSQATTSRMAAASSEQEADAAKSQAATARMAAANSEQEADAAKSQAATARMAAASSGQEADAARSQAATARMAAASSEQEAAELQRQINALQAKVTDRGLVLTLGDVLFETGRADLKAGAAGNLNKLVAFLTKYPERVVAIEGYTDSVGSEDYNQALSQRRADSVRSYLIRAGIESGRLTASGMGKDDPVAGNDSAIGRQQNRRVAVIINNSPTALR